jgi:hypothetical protein
MNITIRERIHDVWHLNLAMPNLIGVLAIPTLKINLAIPKLLAKPSHL